MDLFQIMCVNGCGNDSGAVWGIISAIIRINFIVVPFIILIVTLAQIVDWIYREKKNKKRISREELRKKVIKRIIAAVIIFVVFFTANYAVDHFKPEYDEYFHCWCK